MENIKSEIELTTVNRWGTVLLSSKCRKILKKEPSIIAEQFNPHDKDVNYIIEILPNKSSKRDTYNLNIKRLLPLFEKIQGNLTIKFPNNKGINISNNKSFVRELKVKELVIEGNDLEIERYSICEADNLEKMTIKGATHLAHSAFSKNRSLKEINLIAGKNKELIIEGQVYKPADKYNVSGYEKIVMEIPLLSSNPFIFADAHKCPSIKIQDRVFYDLAGRDVDKGVLELTTSPKYRINTNTKFELLVKDTDTYINGEEVDVQIKDILKNVQGKTFAELLNLPKDKEVDIEVKDIYKAIALIVGKENKAKHTYEIMEVERKLNKSKKFDWHKQQKEQDVERATKIK